MLLVDCVGSGFDIELLESSTHGGLVKFRGKFQEANAINKNKREYPFEVLDENVERLQEMIRENKLVGELDHPTDSIIHFANASHLITKLWWQGNILMGEGAILSTPHGQVLKALINDGVKIGISSRGVGNGRVNEDGVLVIGESYKLITFDVVADPSTYNAYQKRITGKDESVSNDLWRERARKRYSLPENRNKNENTGIDIVNKDLLLAYVRSLATSQTEHYKTRLV